MTTPYTRIRAALTVHAPAAEVDALVNDLDAILADMRMLAVAAELRLARKVDETFGDMMHAYYEGSATPTATLEARHLQALTNLRTARAALKEGGE